MWSSSAAATTVWSAPPIWRRRSARSPCWSGAAVVGGAAVTEEFHPGFRNSRRRLHRLPAQPQGHPRSRPAAAWLAHRRAQVVEFPAAGRHALPEDRRRQDRTGSGQILGARRARLAEYAQRLDVIADVLRDLVLETPPNVTAGSWLEALPELLRGARLGKRIAKLDMTMRRELLDLFVQIGGRLSRCVVRERPDQGGLRIRRHRRQLCEPLRRRLGLCAAASRIRRGQRQEGRLGSRDRRHGRDHAGDGQGGCRARCRDSSIEPRCAKSSSRPGARVGVVTGRTAIAIRARSVVSNLNPKLLYGKLIDRVGARARFPRAHEQLALRLRHIPHERRAFGIAAISRACPGARCGASYVRHHHGAEPRLHGAGLSRRDARGGWSKQPIVEMLIPSTLDDSLAPPGQHVASLFCQHVAPAAAGRRLVGRSSRTKSPT